MMVPQGEGSGTPTESYHTPTSKASQSSQHELPSPSLPPVPTKSLPTIIPSDNPPLRQYTKRTRIAQSSVLSPVANEPASPIGDDKSETPKKKKVQEQIDVQLVRELEKEMARDTQRMNEQIARDAETARIHAEEDNHRTII
nr:hypothetical protein [Tanacetum cinerariifolium]